jgi:hypothetical protein
MESFVWSVIVCAVLGGLYGHLEVFRITARTIADVRSIAIDENDAHARRARAETIGRIQGLYFANVMRPAIAGAVLGVFAWLFS